MDETKQYQIGIQIHIKIVNGGATPANNFSLNTWLTAPLSYTTPVDKGDDDFGQYQPIYLAPNDHKFVRVGIYGEDYPKELHDDLTRGRRCIKLLGEASYDDQFGNSQTMSFRFKAVHRPPKNLVGEMVIADQGLIST